MISFRKVFISTILFIGGSFFIPKLAGAGDSNVQAPFNTGDVIERVSHHPRVEGNRIVIHDRVYEASFDRGRVTLRPWIKKGEGEDLVIPLSGDPLIRGERVVYRQKEGEISFEGKNLGLKVEQVSHHRALPALGYTGDAAKLFWMTESKNRKSGEFLVDTNVVYVPPTNDQFAPAVAFGGTNYLVAWEDYDNSTGGSNIHGARVALSGEVLDPAGIVISRVFGIQYDPKIAFDGTNYLIVWYDYRSQISWDIFGARMSTSGSVLDPDGIAICTDPNTQYGPSVAFDGYHYLVIWQDNRGGNYQIYGTRVSTSGYVLDPQGIAVTPDSGSQWWPSIVFGGTNYLIVWRDSSYNIYGARVDTSGNVIDTAGIAISTAPNNQDCPAAAFDGVNYFVVWSDWRGGSGYADIYGARVSQGGNVIDTSGIAISTAVNEQNYPAIAFNGSNYLVAWVDSRDSYHRAIFCARVSTSGNVLEPNGIEIAASREQNGPSVGFDGTNFFVVWQGNWNTNRDIYGARVDASGTVLDPGGFDVCTEASLQTLPSIASDGSDFLVVWQDWRGASREDVYGVRISPSGALLDTAAIPISTAPYNQSAPSVTFDGKNYLAVWYFSGGGVDVYGARVSPSGQVLDPSGIPISTAPNEQFNPSVASDGTNSLVVWSDYRRGGNLTSDLYGARVSGSGVVLDTNGIGISVGGGYHFNPRIAFDGRKYLVVWSNYSSSGTDIYGSRVDTSGHVLGGITIAAGDNSKSYPSVAFDGTNFFVVWEDWRNDKSDIYGARVDTSGPGHVIDTAGIAISITHNNKYSPSVAFDGLNYLAVWVDSSIGSDYDICGARVSPSGVVLDSFSVTTQMGNQKSPVLAKGLGNQLLIAYSGFTDSVNTHPANSMRIWGKFYPFTGVETEKGISISKGMPYLRVSPNPFREKAWVSANVPGRLKVYDALGRLVREFPKEAAKPGPLAWDGTDEHGRRLPGGVYFLRFEHGTGCETRKVVLLR